MTLGHLTEHLDKLDVVEVPLDKLAYLVKQFKLYESHIKSLEDELKEAKARFNQVAQVELPELLLQNGLSEIKLATGEKIKVSQEIAATIKDAESFGEFLAARGDDDIMRTMLSLGKVPAPLLKKIVFTLMSEYNISPDAQQTVHPQTLKKYIKELCGIGKEDADDCLSLQDLPESISVYTYYKTTIK